MPIFMRFMPNQDTQENISIIINKQRLIKSRKQKEVTYIYERYLVLVCCPSLQLRNVWGGYAQRTRWTRTCCAEGASEYGD